jgi:site-specific recombinase XerC
MAWLLAAAPTSRDAALLGLMPGCGLRVKEITALKVEQLDGAGRYLHAVNGKGGKRRTSILPKPVLDALNAHLQDKDRGIYLSRAKIRAISPPGKSRGYWTKLPRMQDSRR